MVPGFLTTHISHSLRDALPSCFDTRSSNQNQIKSNRLFMETINDLILIIFWFDLSYMHSPLFSSPILSLSFSLCNFYGQSSPREFGVQLNGECPPPL